MTFLTDGLMAGLALFGRYGTQGFAASIFLGLALPQFAAAARPLLAVCIFVFVTITFARVEAAALRGLLRRPGPLVLASLWLILAPVAIVTAGLAILGRETLDPGLVLGLAVLAAAPPIMSAPAVAMPLGLNPTLVTAAVLVTTTLSPLVSPFLADLVAGAVVPLDMRVLITRLVGLIGGAMVAAAVLRAVLGEGRIRANKAQFDGLGVLMYFLFAIAAMDGVLAAAIADPAEFRALPGGRLLDRARGLCRRAAFAAAPRARGPLRPRLRHRPAQHGPPHRGARRVDARTRPSSFSPSPSSRST